MKPITLPYLNALALIAVLAINALANILPINGYNTGEVSAFYPSLFTPAGFTFSVWSVIYLLLIVFVLSQRKIKASDFFSSFSKWFLISCAANFTWILAWHYLLPEVSMIIMLALLFCLTKIFLLLQKEKFNALENFLIRLPFTFYFSWICVATIANFSAVLVFWHWDGGFLTPLQWTISLIVIATLLGLFISNRFREPAFLLITAWALFGIYSRWKSSEFNSISTAALICIAAIGAVFVYLSADVIRNGKIRNNLQRT
jgi:hypothetical protein